MNEKQLAWSWWNKDDSPQMLPCEHEKTDAQTGSGQGFRGQSHGFQLGRVGGGRPRMVSFSLKLVPFWCDLAC